MVDYYKNRGFNATVIVDSKRTGVINRHGAINLKVLAAYYKPQVEEEVEGSGANCLPGKLKHRNMDLVSYTQLKVQPYLVSSQVKAIMRNL